jgi:type I restriction enzyme, S subunit
MSVVKEKQVGYSIRPGYKQTEVGLIPEDWEVKTLAEISPRQSVGLVINPSTYFRSDGAVPNVFVKMDLPPRVFVQEGDILICVRNGSRDLIGKCAKINSKAEAARHVFGAFMAVYRTQFHDFIYHQFQSDLIKGQIHEHLGATINQITNKSLNSFEVPVPEREEQTAIANVLSDIDEEIVVIESKIEKARQIKQGMMQELLTGRTRLV